MLFLQLLLINKVSQQVYYIKKYGLSSHLRKIQSSFSKKEYLNNLYGRILFVLQINPADKEFASYQKEIKKLLKQL